MKSLLYTKPYASSSQVYFLHSYCSNLSLRVHSLNIAGNLAIRVSQIIEAGNAVFLG